MRPHVDSPSPYTASEELAKKLKDKKIDWIQRGIRLRIME